MLQNSKIASACSDSVKWAGASEKQSQKTDSVQRLCEMAGRQLPLTHVPHLLIEA